MESAPRRLGLDIATRTGYAISEGSKIIRSGVRDFSHEHPGQRGIKFYNFLLSCGHIDEIYVEQIMFGGGFKNAEGRWISRTNDNRELYHGFLMLVNMYSAGFCIPVFSIHPTTLKKEFAGHGHADKTDMCAAARSMGWKGGVANTALFHDEVDAIAVLVVEAKRRHGVRLTF